LAGLDKGMVQVSTPWTNTSTNRCFATAAKWLSQKSCKFWISERYKL
jgi:hypothetical protein